MFIRGKETCTEESNCKRKTEKERGGEGICALIFPIAIWGAWKTPQSTARLSRSWQLQFEKHKACELHAPCGHVSGEQLDTQHCGQPSQGSLFPSYYQHSDLTQHKDNLALLYPGYSNLTLYFNYLTHAYLFLPNDLLSIAMHSAAPWPDDQ